MFYHSLVFKKQTKDSNKRNIIFIDTMILCILVSSHDSRKISFWSDCSAVIVDTTCKRRATLCGEIYLHWSDQKTQDALRRALFEKQTDFLVGNVMTLKVWKKSRSSIELLFCTRSMNWVSKYCKSILCVWIVGNCVKQLARRHFQWNRTD